MSIAIKISQENYKELCALSGQLRVHYQRPVSLNDTLHFLLKRRTLSDLAGSWAGSEQETVEILKDLSQGWKKWQIKSV